LQDDLFAGLERLASEMGLSRSGVLALALSEYLERHQNRLLSAQLKVALDEPPEPEETETLEAQRRHQRSLEPGESTK
jgi:hypothetical protein